MATEIDTWAELSAVRSGLSGNYELIADLDADSADYDTRGNAWTPWTTASVFTGTFDGKNHTVGDLICNLTGGADYASLVGRLDHANAVIENLTLADCDIDGDDYSAGIVGLMTSGLISNCHITGTSTITGVDDFNGGIAGRMNGGTVDGCSNSATIGGDDNNGGIAGYVYFGAITITNCTNTGTVNGDNYSGGMVGRFGNDGDGVVSNCINTGAITSNALSSISGGIVGYKDNGTIEDCYNTGAVSSLRFSGGIVGRAPAGTITRCYNTATITTTGTSTADRSAGIIGYMDNGTISYCFSVGAVAAFQGKGGVIGTYVTGTVTNCGWLTNAGGATYAIYSSSGSVTHETTTASNFYNREFNYVASTTNGMFRDKDGTYYWTLGSPWYWWTTKYPLFTQQPAPPSSTANSIFFGCHF